MSILVELDGIDVDCARETLRLRLRALGSNHCHQGTRTCFGDDHGLPNLSRRLASRKRTAPEGSYTRRLLEDSELLRSKLIEEAGELAEARKPEHVAAEAADVIYFALVALARADVPLSAVEEELDRRALHLDRRPGDAKPAGEAPRPTDAGAPNPTDGGAPK